MVHNTALLSKKNLTKVAATFISYLSMQSMKGIWKAEWSYQKFFTEIIKILMTVHTV